MENTAFLFLRILKKYFFNLCDNQIFSGPSDMGYTAPVDYLVQLVHKVPALHLLITLDGVAVVYTASLSSCDMSHYLPISWQPAACHAEDLSLRKTPLIGLLCSVLP